MQPPQTEMSPPKVPSYPLPINPSPLRSNFSPSNHHCSVLLVTDLQVSESIYSSVFLKYNKIHLHGHSLFFIVVWYPIIGLYQSLSIFLLMGCGLFLIWAIGSAVAVKFLYRICLLVWSLFLTQVFCTWCFLSLDYVTSQHLCGQFPFTILVSVVR